MKRFCTALALIALTSSGVCWAISSEPVYIKGPEAAQAFKAQLEKLVKLVDANSGLFDGLGDFTDLLESEASKFRTVKRGEDPGKIEITKIYRSLDAAGRKLVVKRTPASAEVQSLIKESLDWIEQQNSLKNIVRGW